MKKLLTLASLILLSFLLVSCDMTTLEKPILKETNKVTYELEDLEKFTKKLVENNTKSIKSNFSYSRQGNIVGFDVENTINSQAHIVDDEFSIKYNMITSNNGATSKETTNLYKQKDKYYLDIKDVGADKKEKDKGKYSLTKEQLDILVPELYLPTYNPYSLITNNLLTDLKTIEYEGFEIYRTFIDHKISITINKESFDKNPELLTPILINSFNIKDENLNIMKVVNDSLDFSFNTIIVIKNKKIIQYTNSFEYETVGIEYSIKNILTNTVNYTYSTIKYPSFEKFVPFTE